MAEEKGHLVRQILEALIEERSVRTVLLEVAFICHQRAEKEEQPSKAEIWMQIAEGIEKLSNDIPLTEEIDVRLAKMLGGKDD